jgi:hypothetical protein
MPDGVSSHARAARGSTPRRSHASRYGAGDGLPSTLVSALTTVSTISAPMIASARSTHRRDADVTIAMGSRPL